MNKKIGMTAAVLAGALVLSLGIYQSDASQVDPKLSEEDILDLVSAQYPGEITELELEKGLDRMIYEVEVAGESKEYDMELDGDTGEVLEIREKEMVSIPKETNDEHDTVEIEERNEDRTETANTTHKQSADSKDILSVEQVEELALKEFSGVIKELELDKDDGRLIYELEIKNENREEAELDMDAYTGEILKMELEMKGRGKATSTNHKFNDILSMSEVKEIALTEFPGMIKEIELDKDDGRLIYELEIKNKGKEAEMEMDARTGKILEMEIDD
ncbi:PepSY domain-containing protein [Virgibacillus kimchii]